MRDGGSGAGSAKDNYGNPGEPGNLTEGERGVWLRLRQDKYELIEFGLQYQGERMDAKVSAHYNRYDHFIYVADTGSSGYWDEEDEERPIRQWTQADARFHGFEGEATFHLANNDTGAWDLRVFGDTVQGSLADGGNLPRIPPPRFGGELRWEGTSGWRVSAAATAATAAAARQRAAAHRSPRQTRVDNLSPTCYAGHASHGKHIALAFSATIRQFHTRESFR